MNLTSYITRLKQAPKTIAFTDTMATIEEHYVFTPTAFQNGNQQNATGENSGSCKLFAFAKLQNLSQEETLACFGGYYFEDVLKNPEGNDHQNIRNFIKTGWNGIQFHGEALELK
ncbi:MAG TPA: HopJ type III effector protein [Flavobacterium sp.]|uniref:HopJ type III effector protein n=1 Tax=Flavobacterium sp. TaxID=239 RepID=UPI002F3F215D